MSNSIISYRVDIVLRTTQVDSCSSRSLGRRRRHAHHTRNAPSSSNRSAVHHTPARSEHLYDRDHTGIYRWLRRTLSRRRSHTLRCSSPRNVLHRILRLVNHACKVSWARFRNADYTYKIKKTALLLSTASHVRISSRDVPDSLYCLWKSGTKLCWTISLHFLIFKIISRNTLNCKSAIKCTSSLLLSIAV